MTQEEIFKKVGNILADLNQQYNYLSTNISELNELEVELFLANADFLADHVKIIEKLNHSKTEIKPEKGFTHIIEDVEPDSLSSETDNETERHAVEEIVAQEQAEERVDLKSKEELREDEIVHTEIAQNRNNDFFKPDLEERSFEFELEKMVEARGDVEDHELAAANEEDEFSFEEKELQDESKSIKGMDNSNFEDDEIGPEPFLISAAQESQPDEEQEVPSKAEPSKDKPQEVTKKAYVPPTTAERNERNGINLDSGSSSSSVGGIASFSPEVVRTESLPSAFQNDSFSKEEGTSKEGTTLNDMLGKKATKAEPNLKAPISDLKQAINLNEKMLFIKDLFGGYNMAYSEAIELVNKMTTFDNAEKFLRNNYAAKNNWASKQNTVDQFYEILHKRFDK